MGVEVKSMEIKKNPSINITDKANTASVKKVQQFVADVKGEIQKITWTNREELMTYTQIVVFATIFFGMVIYFLDLIIQTFLFSLHWIVSIISG